MSHSAQLREGRTRVPGRTGRSGWRTPSTAPRSSTLGATASSELTCSVGRPLAPSFVVPESRSGLLDLALQLEEEKAWAPSREENTVVLVAKLESHLRDDEGHVEVHAPHARAVDDDRPRPRGDRRVPGSGEHVPSGSWSSWRVPNSSVPDEIDPTSGLWRSLGGWSPGGSGGLVPGTRAAASWRASRACSEGRQPTPPSTVSPRSWRSWAAPCRP